MGQTWFIVFGLEVAWLAALWYLVPESRPWSRVVPSEAPPPIVRKRRTRTAFLHCYVIYHGFAILWALVVRLVDYKRVRPEGFLILGFLAGLIYAVSFSTIYFLEGWLILAISTILLHIFLAIFRARPA